MQFIYSKKFSGRNYYVRDAIISVLDKGSDVLYVYVIGGEGVEIPIEKKDFKKFLVLVATMKCDKVSDAVIYVESILHVVDTKEPYEAIERSAGEEMTIREKIIVAGGVYFDGGKVWMLMPFNETKNINGDFVNKDSSRVDLVVQCMVTGGGSIEFHNYWNE